jgi:hypothetical protein
MEAAALRNSGSGDTPYREFLISFSERFGAADSQALIVDVHTGIGDAQFSRNILPSQTPAFRDSMFRVFGWLAYVARCATTASTGPVSPHPSQWGGTPVPRPTPTSA